ncbi:hypothetical protein DUNSADRAFT_7226, partial [Dunaliella salina]
RLFSLLPDRPSQGALLASCKSVRCAPSVLSQIVQLTVYSKMLQNSSSSAPLLCFPLGAQLKKLVIKCTGSGAQTAADYGPLLMETFQPQQGEMRQKVNIVLQNVTELTLQACRVKGGTSAPALGRLVRSMTKLRVLRISDSARSFWLPFLGTLPGYGGRDVLMELDVCVTDFNSDTVLEDVSHIVNLRILSLKICQSASSIQVDPLASLRALETLHIRWMEHDEDHSHATWVDLGVGLNLVTAFSGMNQLRSLTTTYPLTAVEVAALPKSIEDVSFEFIDTSTDIDGRCLCHLLRAEEQLPDLQNLHFDYLNFAWIANMTDAFNFWQHV